MASRTEARVVLIAAMAQGVALVTFPAASTVFTSPKEYGLTSSAYGAMFVPQAIAAVAASILGASWAQRVGTRKVYLVGMLANVISMTLLVISAIFEHDEGVAYALLLCATFSLGVGFGFTVPALNTFTAAFNPGRVDSSVLVLNALLGVGTALAPLLVAVFIGLDFWWGLPILAGVTLALVLAASTRLPLEVAQPARAAGRTRSAIPARFWIYAGFAVCYGICETMNGNWAAIDMKDLGASTTFASLALTTFWACVTIGRVGFAALQRWVPMRVTYRVLPVLLAAVFVAISRLPDDKPAARDPHVRVGRPVLLRLASAHDQLRARGAHGDGGIRRGRDHRVLPDRLRHRRVRRGPAARRRHQAVDAVRPRRDRRARPWAGSASC